MRTLCSLISLLLFMQTHGFSQYCFNCGEGSLGDFHATKDTTVLSGTYEFDHFIIDAGVRVKVTGSTALIIRCKGDVQIHGILDLSGENGEHASSNLTPGMGGIGFAGAFSGANGLLALSTATPGTQGQGPGAGPGGWSGAGSGAGYGQPGTGCAVNGGLVYGDSLLHQLYGGSGGGSGASLPGGSSGGGGAGGGILVIHSCQVIQISSSGSILCRGGNGGNGFGSGFAGGGGSGGSILLASKSVLVEGIVDADGGQGGMSSAGGPCQLGGTGAPGRIRINAQETSFNGAIYPSPLIRQLFNAGIRRVVNAKCNGSASGFLKARASGGDRPYTFQWSDGSSTEEIRQLAAGTYTVTITESSGCSVTESVEVGQPDPILTEVVSYPPSCESLQNGQAIFKSSGGHPFPHHGALSTTFWSNNSSHGIMFDFSVNTTLNLKKISLSLPFNGPQRISIFFRMGSMNGFENDSTQWQLISHSLVNGLGADEETPLDLSQLPELSAGKYALYIYNHDTSINCVNSTVIGNTFNFDHVMTIFDGIGRNKSNNAFQATLKGMMNLAGRISYVIKNSKDYAYQFSTSSSSDIHAQVASGNQQVIVTDALGCTAVKPFNVAPASPIPVHLTSIRHPRCSYSNDGEIGIHATAAQHEYYAATTIPFANPANGSVLHIRNSSDIILNGIDFYLNKPGQAALYVKQGDFNGTLNNASAWTFLGNYNLSPGASAGISTLTIGTPLSLAMGEWSLYVYSADDIFRQLDSNAFAGDAYIGYRNSTVRTGSAGAFNNSQKSGSFWAGTLRYSLAQHQLSYLWNNNVAGNTLPNLGGGNYMVTITQDNTCQVQRHYQLIAPDPIQLHPSINQETDYDSNGSVLLNISGGMAPYFVQWVSSAQNGNQLAQLAAGSYPVFVSDFKGCILYDTIEVGRLISPVSSEGQLHLAPNPGQGQFYVAEEVNGMENCRMSIFDETGRLVRDEFTSISSLMSGGLDLRHYADGYYLIRVSDQDQVYHARLIITR